MSRRNAYLAAVANALLAGAVTGQNLIVNGGFEQAPAIPTGQTGVTVTGTEVPGWVIPVGNCDINGPTWNPSQGVRSLDLHGIVLGTIEQSFATVVGVTYELKFDLGATGGTRNVHATAAGQVSPVFSHAGPGFPTVSYALDQTWSFVAAAATTTLYFYSPNTSLGANGPHLDNVRVTLISGPAVTASSTVYGTGCGVPAVTLAPLAQPLLGATASALINNAPTSFGGVAVGFSNTFLGGLPVLPLDLTTIGMAGCELLHSNDVFGLPIAPVTASSYQFDQPLPNQVALLGSHVYVQAYCFAPGANALEIVASNGVDWLLGNQ